MFERLKEAVSEYDVGFLVAEPGFGKSTALQVFADKHNYVFYSLYKHRADTTVPELVAKSIYYQSICRYGLNDESPDFSFPQPVLNNLFERLDKIHADTGSKAVIVIDALDEGSENSIHRLFPPRAFENAVLLFSSRSADFISDMTIGCKASVIDPSDFSEEELRQDMERYLAAMLCSDARDRLKEPDYDRIFERSGGNLQYLHFLCQEANSNSEMLGQPIATLPHGLEGWYRSELRRLEGSTKEELERFQNYIVPVIEMLNVIQEPMSEQHIADILSYPSGEGKAQISLAIREMHGFCILEQRNNVTYVSLNASGFSDFVERCELFDLPEAHKKIVDYYVFGKEICQSLPKSDYIMADFATSINLPCNLPAEQNEKKQYQDRHEDGYGLKHLVKHAELSNSPKTVLDIMTPSYVKHKMASFPSVGLVMDDLNIAISVAADNRDLVSAFKYAILRGHIYSAANKPMLGLESVLRARMGDAERAIADIERFGNQDDRLLVYAEIAAQLWADNREASRRYLHRMEVISQDVSPESLEMVATRIAEVEPRFALNLARRIPIPKPLEDRPGGAEDPTRERCVFMIFGELARQNLSLAVALADDIEEHFERDYAFAAIGVAVLPEQPSKGLEILSRILSDLHDFDEGRCERILSYVLGMYTLRYIPDMDFERSLSTFRTIADWISLHPERMEIIYVLYVLDTKINECPLLWSEVSAKLPACSLRDLIRWRLIELGHMPITELGAFDDEVIQDVMRSNWIAEIASSNPLEAVGLGDDLESLAGYARAISAIAKKVGKFDQSMASALVAHASASRSVKDDWEGFDAVLELLKTAIRWPGEPRRQLVTFCLDVSAKLEPEYLRADARLALGRVLAGSFKKHESDRSDFFSSLILDFDSEIYRSAIASCIMSSLSEDDCRAMSLHREEFGLVSQSNLLCPSDGRLFLPETQVKLLVCLSERLTLCDPQIASQLLLDAASITRYIEDRQDRNMSVNRIARCAVKISPDFVWEVYQCCGDTSQVYLLSGIERGLREYAAVEENPWEKLARLHIEIALAIRYYEDYAGNHAYDNRCFLDLLHLEKSEAFPPLVSGPSMYERPPDEWVQKIPGFLSRCIDDFDPDDYLLRELHKITELIARIDWDTFMKMLRDPKLGPPLVKNVKSKALLSCVLKSQNNASKLLDDIKAIQKLKDDRIEEDEAENAGFFRIILAAAAAYDPALCIDLIASLAPNDRYSFAEDLELFAPGIAWTEEQLSSLFGLLDASMNTEDVISAEAHMLQWLGRRFGAIPCFVERIASRASSLGSSAILKIAKYSKQLDRKSGENLMQTALNRAIQECNTFDIVEILNNSDFLEAKVRLRALETAREVVMQTEERNHLHEIAKHQARLNLDEAVATLSLMDPGNNNIEKVLDAIADSITVKNEGDIELWVSRILQLENLSQKHMNSFSRNLIRRGLDEGVVKSTQILQHITDADDKVEALLVLSRELKDKEREPILKQASSEAKSGTSVLQRERAFCKLGHFYLHSDQSQALRFYIKALVEVAKQENAFNFIQTVSEAAGTCLDLEKEHARKLANEIHNAVLRFPYSKYYRNARDSKAQALVWSALSLWPSNESEAAMILGEAASEYERCIQLGDLGLESGSWEFEISQACLKLVSRTSLSAAKSMLSELLLALPDAGRQEVADNILRKLCNPYDNKDRPLERFHIWQPRLSDTECMLLRHLLPFCSPRGAMRLHLALAVSAWERDHQTVVNEIQHAVDLDEQTDSVDASVWIAYAASHGLAGCYRAIGRLFPRSEYIRWNVPELLMCAIEQMPDKTSFLYRLWASLQSIRNYL